MTAGQQQGRECRWHEQRCAVVTGLCIVDCPAPSSAPPARDGGPLADLVAQLQRRRRDSLTAIRNCHPDNTSDYWRWQGHAELSRQLLEQLGAEVPR